jgi:hypothetical protein
MTSAFQNKKLSCVSFCEGNDPRVAARVKVDEEDMASIGGGDSTQIGFEGCRVVVVAATLDVAGAGKKAVAPGV